MTPLPVSAFGRRLARRRRTAAWLAVLVVAGFALRWSTARIETLLSSDSCQYLHLARGIAEGRGYVSGGSEHPDVTRLPVLPLLVAGLGRITGDFDGAGRVVATLAGALMTVPICWLSRRTFGPDAAWAGAALGAFSCLHGYSGFLLPDPIALLFLLWAAASTADAARRPRWSAFARTGIFAALAALTRPEAILVAPLLAAAVLASARRRRLPGAIVVLSCAALVYAPYAAWTSWKLGRFAPAPGLEYVLDARELSDRLGLRWIGDPGVAWNDKARFMLDRSGDRFLLETYFTKGRLPDFEPPPMTWTLPADERGAARKFLDGVFRRARIVLANVRNAATQLRGEHLAPPGPWALAGAGMLLAFARRSARRMLPVLIAAGLVTFTPLYSHVEPRFGYAIFAGACLGAAAAWGALAAALGRRGLAFRAAVHGLVVAVVFAPALAHDPRADARSARRLAQRAIALAADRALPPGPLLANRPLVAYYAGRPYRALPLAPPERVIAFAHAVGAVGIVLEASLDRTERPDLATWLGDDDPPGLRRVARRDDPEAGTFLVYALERPSR